MKKHENAIKMLMKNAVDCSYYGYYESENGARYLTNGHLIIKLFNTYSTVTTDFVGDLPRLNDTNFLNRLVDFVEAHKNGDYKIQLHMSNVKMWDKYNDTDNCYKLEYDKNKYIGFSADYMKRLYTLTGDNCITIIDSKSPIYISGVGIECVFLPCWLDDNYNADNYEQFKEELRACYIQDAKTKEENEKQKALKNTNKIEKEVIYNGFTLYFAGRQLFLLSDKKRVTNDITNDFLKIMTDITGIDYINKRTEYDYIYYKACVQAATITKTKSYSGNEEIYRIETKSNPETFYKNEYDRLIIYNGNMEKVDILADDMSATVEETPKTATIQDNAADIVKADTVKDDTCTATDTANNDNMTATQDIKAADTMQDTTNNAITSETMQADARQDTIQTETTQDTPHKTSAPAVSLFVVTDKPQPVKLYSANIPTLERIPTYTQRIISRLQPLKSHRVYNTRVSNKKPLKKAYNDFVGTVSCYNDKCAISGDMVAVNSS